MDLDFADVKPTVLSWLTVGVMAVTFIVLLKWLVTAFPNQLKWIAPVAQAA